MVYYTFPTLHAGPAALYADNKPRFAALPKLTGLKKVVITIGIVKDALVGNENAEFSVRECRIRDCMAELI
jgi:hypothetical protein